MFCNNYRSYTIIKKYSTSEYKALLISHRYPKITFKKFKFFYKNVKIFLIRI
jgi:hypothetical protein